MRLEILIVAHIRGIVTCNSRKEKETSRNHTINLNSLERDTSCTTSSILRIKLCTSHTLSKNCTTRPNVLVTLDQMILGKIDCSWKRRYYNTCLKKSIILTILLDQMPSEGISLRIKLETTECRLKGEQMQVSFRELTGTIIRDISRIKH